MTDLIDYSESDFIAWQAERERHLAEVERLLDALKAIAAIGDWKAQLTIANEALGVK